MWTPSVDFSYGFASGVSLFLLVELIRCIRLACTKNQQQKHTETKPIPIASTSASTSTSTSTSYSYPPVVPYSLQPSASAPPLPIQMPIQRSMNYNHVHAIPPAYQ